MNTSFSSLLLCIKHHTNEQQESRMRCNYISPIHSLMRMNIYEKETLLPFSSNRSYEVHRALPMIVTFSSVPVLRKVTHTIILGRPWMRLLNNLKLGSSEYSSVNKGALGCSCPQQSSEEEEASLFPCSFHPLVIYLLFLKCQKINLTRNYFTWMCT